MTSGKGETCASSKRERREVRDRLDSEIYNF
jgi:hypothetical protein